MLTGIREKTFVKENGMVEISAPDLPVGTEVIISPARHVAGVTPPVIKGRVVRSSAQGIGIEFLEPSFS